MKHKRVIDLATVALVATMGPAVLAGTYTWNSTLSGNWNTTNSTGWNTESTYPNAIGDSAIFAQDITVNRTITINVTDAKVGSLTLGDPNASHNWTIASGGSTQKLTFDVASGSATINATGTNTISAPIVLNDSLFVSLGGGKLSYSPKPGILGDKSLTVTNGYLDLSEQWPDPAHQFKPLTVRAGATVRSRSGVNDSCRVTVDAGGTYIYAASGSDWMGGISGAGAIQLVTGSLLMGGSASTFSGVISGAGGIRMDNAVLTLSGVNTFTGATTLMNGGDLFVQNGSAIADTAAIDFGSSDGAAIATTILKLDNASETVGSVRSAYGTGAINLQGYTLTTGGKNTDTTFAGAITGTGGRLIKQGTGTFTLTGTSTYTGATIVSNGVLLVNGANNNGGDLTAVSGGKLGGTGMIDPANTKVISIDVGGVLQPGGGTTGTLTVGSASSLNNVNLNGSLNVVAVANRDPAVPWLVVNGDLNFGASSTVTATGLDTLDKGVAYVLAKYSGALTGSITDDYVEDFWRVMNDAAAKKLILHYVLPTTLIVVK